MTNDDKILAVLEEMRDMQKESSEKAKEQFQQMSKHFEKTESKYDEYLANSRKLYRNHLRNVIIILIIALAVIPFLI